MARRMARPVRPFPCGPLGVLAARAAVAVVLCCAGCARPGYFEHRLRDVSDIFTLTLGRGYGAKVRAGPIQIGLLDQVDEFGHRGGGAVVTVYHPGGRDFLGMPLSGGEENPGEDRCWLLYGEEEFSRFVGRGKAFTSASLGPFALTEDMPLLHAGYAPYYYTQLEVVLAAGRSVRIGVNPGELLDFVLGWTTLDYFDDDRAPSGAWRGSPMWWPSREGRGRRGER